jgi:hypothetical protein
MLRVFIGYDHRQPVAYNVLQHSIIKHSSKPVAITPLVLHQLPMKRTGLTPFTFTRFLVPWLCNYEGWALFLDIDMLLLGDIAELFAFADDKYAVQVSKNPIRFEWASAMLFNCSKCKILTPEFIEDPKNDGLHTLKWATPEEIGEFPSEWNHLVGYDKPRDDAKLIHFTQGIPCFPETIRYSEYANAWHNEHKQTNSAYPWAELMARSVHSKQLPDGRIVPKLWREV